MKKLMRKKISMILLLSMFFNLGFPIYQTYAGSPSVDVNLPIADLEGMIAQLREAGSSLIGDAGNQMKAVISELTDKMQLLVDQVKNAAKEVINEAATQLDKLMRDTIAQAKSLLVQVNNMVKGIITCFDAVLAKNIAQINDDILSILDQANKVIKEAVDRIYTRSTQLIDTGTNRVAVVLNSTLNIIAKVIIIIFAFILLFWLIRALWQGTFPKNKVLRIAIPSLIVLLVAGCAYLMFSPTAISRILGSNVSLPKWENSCNTGDKFYSDFIQLKNQNAQAAAIKTAGDSALVNLNWCLYACNSPEISRGTQKKIDDIAAMLYPLPAPPPSNLPNITPCTQGTGPSHAAPISINPAWLSANSLQKVNVINTLVSQKVLRTTAVPALVNESVYFDNVQKLTKQDPKAIILKSQEMKKAIQR